MFNRSILLPLFLLLSMTISQAQIFYNKTTTYSEKYNLASDKGDIFFVDDNFDFKNLNINLLDRSRIYKNIEPDTDVYLYNIDIITETVGNLSIILETENHDENTLINIFTPDYSIIAGPITHNSYENSIPIVNIPTYNLIVEVVSKNHIIPSIKLTEIAFTTIRTIQKNIDTKQSSDSCFTCPQNTIDHAKNYVNANSLGSNCVWLGGGNNTELFGWKSYNTPEMTNLDASRSSCIIMYPYFDSCNTTSNIYKGLNGTLVNFPYEDCGTPSCSSPIILTTAHIGLSGLLHDATIDYYENNDQTSKNILDNTIIRFNWEYKYDIPWHLFGGDACENSINAYNQWRDLFNFDEVIDYCGIRSVAQRTVFPAPPPFLTRVETDVALFRMTKQPRYKELFLGMSTINEIDTKHSSEYYIDQDFYVMGRRNVSPTTLIKPYFFDGSPSGSVAFTFFVASSKVEYSDNVVGLSGYSGSTVIVPDPLDNKKALAIGSATKYGGVPGVMDAEFNLRFFNDASFTLFDKCTNETLYIQNLDTLYYPLKIEDHFDTIQYTQRWITDKHSRLDTSFSNHSAYYRPSLEVYEKCSSNGTTLDDSCTVNLSDYIIIDSSGSGYCVTINEIPASEFPGFDLPKGYRIYNNVGSQKLFKYLSPATNGGADISFPISFCIDECELNYLTLSEKDIKIKIDFYNANGYILADDYCNDIEFQVSPPDICEKLDVTVTRLDSMPPCCTYEIEVELAACGEYNPAFKTLMGGMTFQSFQDSTAVSIDSVENLDVDYENGKLTFTKEICEASFDTTSTFVFYYNGKKLDCVTPDIDFSLCECICPTPVDTEGWLSLTSISNNNQPGCICKVTADLEIPSVYDCYTHYQLPTDSVKRSIGDGKDIYVGGDCLDVDSTLYLNILLYKGVDDSLPCQVSASLACEFEDNFEPCTPNCDSIEWNEGTTQFQIDSCSTNGTCRVEVNYLSRDNICDGTQEIQITSMLTFTWSPRDSIACYNCIGDFDALYKEAVLKIIHRNQMNFDPLMPNQIGQTLCDSTWRVTQASCWGEYSYRDHSRMDPELGTPAFTTVYKPCEGNDCCSIGLLVCRTFEGNNKSSITTSTIGNTTVFSCDTITTTAIVFSGFYSPGPDGNGNFPVYHDLVLDCDARCDALYGLNTSEPYMGKMGEYIEGQNLEQTDVQNSVSLKINVISKRLEIIIFSDEDYIDSKFILSDLTGKQLSVDVLDLKTGETSLYIPNTDLYPGVYIISLLHSNQIIATRKVLVR